VISRFKYLPLLVAAGLACKSAVNPPPPPVPPPPPPPNRAPVAAVGGPYDTESGTVVFDGSASSDPDGDAITFAWQFGDGASSSEMKPSHRFDQSGDYNVSLTVTDAKGLPSGAAATTATVTLPSVLVGAGNIATCGSSNDQATARLVDAIPGATVFTLGDNVFPMSTPENYSGCYAPSWGQFLDRTHATLGNHEYEGDPGATWDYFGDRAGPRGLGYYSYPLGSWHIIVLNDHGGSSVDGEQLNWLADDLQKNTKQCMIAMWHVPLFLSSHTQGWNTNPGHKPVWDLLYAAGVDVVLNGQQHNYERFAPMTPAGVLDSDRGIREFNVGTGGESIDDFEFIHPNSEVHAKVFGVLKLTLKRNSYDWQFIPVAGSTFSDSGSGSCH
jgi:PKD repeat protein